MSITTSTAQQLRAAADLQERIEALQAQMNELLGDEAPAPAEVAIEAPQGPTNGRRRRKFSAEARAKMAASQRARWAAIRGEAAPEWTSAGKPGEPRKTKKQVSEARLKALAKAREARWAKVRAAKRAGFQSEEGPATGAEKPKKKRTISAAGRRAMALAAKKRWAKARRAEKLPF